MSFITGTATELLYASTTAGITKNTWTTEIGINDTTTMGVVAHIPPDFWLPNNNSVGRGIRICARGILTSTGTPTFTFTIRGGNTYPNVSTTPILLGSAALTTTSGAAAPWELQGDIILKAIGASGQNSTCTATGAIWSAGLNPIMSSLYGAAATPGTVATVDTSVVNYINFNVACSVSSASNGVTLQQLLVFGLN
jgi:hypothetical protein